MAIYLTGGSRIEDAKRLSAQFSEKSQGYRLCSPDTILKTLSDKAEEDTFVESGEGNRYKFSINAGLSGLLLDGMQECGQIDEATIHTFDYDNQFIPTEKYDSKYSYKKAFGYSQLSSITVRQPIRYDRPKVPFRHPPAPLAGGVRGSSERETMRLWGEGGLYIK